MTPLTPLLPPVFNLADLVRKLLAGGKAPEQVARLARVGLRTVRRLAAEGLPPPEQEELVEAPTDEPPPRPIRCPGCRALILPGLCLLCSLPERAQQEEARAEERRCSRARTQKRRGAAQRQERKERARRARLRRAAARGGAGKRRSS